jgi:hypothetical protein
VDSQQGVFFATLGVLKATVCNKGETQFFLWRLEWYGRNIKKVASPQVKRQNAPDEKFCL